MRFDPILSAFQARVRKNHLRLAIAFGVKNVKIAIDVGFKRDANAIAVVKFTGRIDADGAAVDVAHKHRVAEGDRLQRRLRRILVGAVGVGVRRIGVARTV